MEWGNQEQRSVQLQTPGWEVVEGIRGSSLKKCETLGKCMMMTKSGPEIVEYVLPIST